MPLCSPPPAETNKLRRPLTELETLSTMELFEFLRSCFPTAELKAVSTVLALREFSADAINKDLEEKRINLEADLADSETRRAAVAMELSKARVRLLDLESELVKYKNKCSQLEGRIERDGEWTEKIKKLEDLVNAANVRMCEVVNDKCRIEQELQDITRKNDEMLQINAKLREENWDLRDFQEKFVTLMRETKIYEKGNCDTVGKNVGYPRYVAEASRKKSRGSEGYESSKFLVPSSQLEKKKPVKMVIASTTSSQDSLKSCEGSLKKEMHFDKCGGQGMFSKDLENKLLKTPRKRDLQNRNMQDSVIIIDVADECLSSSRGNSLDGECSTSEKGVDSAVIREVISGKLCKEDTPRWTSKDDMIISLQNNCALCLQAVCAIYRQHMPKKNSEVSEFTRKRGFSSFGELRAIEMAEFLTNSDPSGQLKKTIDELESQNPEGVDYCQQLAVNQADQLFEIYVNKDDPYFPS